MLLRLITSASLRSLRIPELKHLASCSRRPLHEIISEQFLRTRADSWGEKLTHVEVYWRTNCLSMCLRTAVDPDAGLGSAGFGDVEDHIRGAGMSQRRPERGQER